MSSKRRAGDLESPARRHSVAGLVLRVIGWIVLVALLGAFCVGMGALAKLHDRFLPMDFQAPASAGPETWAVIGLDDRQFLDEPTDGDTTTGARADVVLLLTKTDAGYVATSVSRDTMVTMRDKTHNRLTMSWMKSTQEFVDDVCDNFGVPIDHLLRFDFRSFSRAVDAVGGIDVTTPYPLRQTAPSQLAIDLPAGTTHVNGETALHFVRSREGEAFLNGQWVHEPDSAAARQKRAAQAFATLLAKAKKNPVTMAKLVWTVAPDIGLDRGFTYSELFPLTRLNSHVGVLPEQTESDVIVNITDDTKKYLTNLGYTGCQV